MPNDSCPFTLGTRPVVFAGRSAELTALTALVRLLDEGAPARSALVVGQIGNGRTTLVRELARVAAEAKWSPAVVTLSPTDDVGQQFARGLATAALHLRQHRQDTAATRSLLKCVQSFGLAHGVKVPIEHDLSPSRAGFTGELAVDLPAVFTQVGALCRQIGTGLVLIFDDAPNALLAELSVVVGVATAANAQAVPILVVLTGLASLGRSLASHGLAAEAVEVVVAGPLSPDDVAAAVAEPARRTGRPFTIDGLESFVRRCRGLPTFAQSLARQSWLASEGPITDRDVAVGAAIVERQLVTAVYEPMHRALSPAHRRFLHALMEEGGTASFDAVRRRLGDTNRFDPNASGLVALRDDLFNREVLASLDGETLEFALAGYDRYIQKVP
jgi:AAA ATPase domain